MDLIKHKNIKKIKFNRTFISCKSLYIMKGGRSVSLELEDQYDKIYKYCYFKVKNKQLAEDLTQETFAKFFSQHTYIDQGKRLAYLYTIAKHLCMDTYRKVDVEVSQEEGSEEGGFEALEMQIILKTAVAALEKDLQEIVMLRYVNELSMKAISQITGESRFTIYRKSNKALARLKAMIGEEMIRCN